METQTYRGYLIAKSPLHHGGDEQSGATALVRRHKYLSSDGRVLNVPVISGNSIRGNMRRMVMGDMLYRIGYGELKNAKVYHMLFAGGSLESVDVGDSGKIDVGMKKKYRLGIPPLGLFGTSIGNQMIEGRLKVGHAIPLCKEIAPMLAPDGEVRQLADLKDIISSARQRSYYELLGHDFQTRRDDLHEEREEGEAAHQMKVDLETVAMGTVFEHTFALWNTSPIEAAVLGRAMELWRTRPYVGGKSGSGYGRVGIYYDVPDQAPWLNYMREHADDLKTIIADLEATI
ncbi:MAG TPA: hypothetical protein PLJ11_04445 [Methanomassiliicoccales archaeon]|nr:hypothetical protein [Methanomassiliicoccales archaeon]